ncbi:hypothetical protein [Actinomadura craniellae]|uniref:hypothetical protein n=1 Tax=Actinomadura craniellae TaxID=2231787 RepID=UPI0013149FE8|nr:hypothetical protein [Actinomadura craniellae]
MSTQPEGRAPQRTEDRPGDVPSAAKDEKGSDRPADAFDDRRPGSGGVQLEDLSPDDFE